MKVKITVGCAWYKGMEGRVFEVTKDDNHPSGFVYLLVEDSNNPDVNWVRYIHSIDCVLVPDEPDELTLLRAELVDARKKIDQQAQITWNMSKENTALNAALARKQAALDAAGEYITHLESFPHHQTKSELRKTYTAAMDALASAQGTETGASKEM